MLSNSTNPGTAYLEHALDWFSLFLRGRRNILFVPYAGVTISWDEYTRKVAEALKPLNVTVTGIHQFSHPVNQIHNYEVIMVGGGNTFALLKALQENNLIDAFRHVILSGGTPYIGWSAGSNIAAPGIFTTNDMPVVQPTSFEALNLIPFQINPHYTEDVLPNFHGETRLQRLQEFLALNPQSKVLGLPEGSALQVCHEEIQVLNGPIALISGPSERQWLHAWDKNAMP